ncbi:MAG: cell division protein FtsZ, partial [Methanomassiliicoccales archaeon]
SPMLGEIDLRQAKGALIRVVGGPDMTVGEAQKAAEIVTQSVSERARIIWGCSIEPELTGTIKILLIVTGAKSKYMLNARGPGMNIQPAPRGTPQYASNQATPQYQQPRQRNEDEVDFVR